MRRAGNGVVGAEDEIGGGSEACSVHRLGFCAAERPTPGRAEGAAWRGMPWARHGDGVAAVGWAVVLDSSAAAGRRHSQGNAMRHFGELVAPDGIARAARLGDIASMARVAGDDGRKVHHLAEGPHDVRHVIASRTSFGAEPATGFSRARERARHAARESARNM